MKTTLASIPLALCAAISHADYIRQATETYPGGGGGGGSPNAVTTNEEGVVEAPLGLTGAYVNNNWFFWFLGGSSVWLYQPNDFHLGGDDYSDGTPLPDYIDARADSQITNAVTSGYLCTVEAAEAMTNGLLRAIDYHGDYITDGTNKITSERIVYSKTFSAWTHNPLPLPGVEGWIENHPFWLSWCYAGENLPGAIPPTETEWKAPADGWYPQDVGYCRNVYVSTNKDALVIDWKTPIYGQSVHSTRRISWVNSGRLATTNDIPTALKNPHALTFTGDSAIIYDGSEPHTVNIPSTPEEVGAYPKAAGEADHTKVTNLLTYVGGQNVRVSVTNYYGNTSGNLPRLRIEEFMTVTNSGVEVQAWNTVWDEDDKFIEFATNINTSVSSMTNASLNALTSITNAIVNYADATKAPKAWGTYASDGTLAPSDTVVHATSKTMFGAEFKCYTIGANQVGFLIAKNVAGYSGAEPGEFKFYNLSGNHFFGMHIRDEVELGCATDGILITNVGGDTMATLTYNVTMTGKPSIHYTPSLDPGQVAWEKLSQRDGTQVPGASKAVTWEAVTTPGTEVCHINMGSAPKGFYYATIDDPAESWLHTDLVLNAQGGILCTNEYTGLTVNVVPYIDDASNTVKWRVKP